MAKCRILHRVGTVKGNVREIPILGAKGTEIIAIQHTDKPGTRITAGLLLAKVHHISDGSYLGGFACEYAGNGSLEEARSNLQEAMRELFARRYKSRFYRLESGKSVVRTFTPDKSFGTILVGIGFGSYLVPVLQREVQVKPSHKDKSHVKYTID